MHKRYVAVSVKVHCVVAQTQRFRMDDYGHFRSVYIRSVFIILYRSGSCMQAVPEGSVIIFVVVVIVTELTSQHHQISRLYIFDSVLRID